MFYFFSNFHKTKLDDCCFSSSAGVVPTKILLTFLSVLIVWGQKNLGIKLSANF